jgi:hypothetical protein
MQYQITHMDRRHSWRDSFEYMLEFANRGGGTGVLDFDRARRWMNRTWGWSQDVRTREHIHQAIERPVSLNCVVTPADDINPAWAYSIEYRNYRIYLKGQAELSWFQLAHAGSGGS